MVDLAKKICFVVGAIGDEDSEVRIHADWLLEEIIQPVLRGVDNFEVIRSDKISSPGMIDAQIIGHLLESEIVIADLSGLNPNAFYEIGVRHMIQKPIVHMQLAEDKIPFDVSLYRAIKFSRVRPSDIRRARDDLKAAVTSVLADDYRVDNPITRARGQISLQLQASPAEKVLSDQVRALQQRMSKLEVDRDAENDDDDHDFFPHFTVRHNLKSDGAIFNAVVNEIGNLFKVGRTRSGVVEIQVDTPKMSYEQLDKLESVLKKIKGVTDVSFIPF